MRLWLVVSAVLACIWLAVAYLSLNAGVGLGLGLILVMVGPIVTALVLGIIVGWVQGINDARTGAGVGLVFGFVTQLLGFWCRSTTVFSRWVGSITPGSSNSGPYAISISSTMGAGEVRLGFSLWQPSLLLVAWSVTACLGQGMGRTRFPEGGSLC